MQHYTTTCGLQLNFRLTRSKRRSIGFHITPQGLEIRAPQRLSLSRIEQAIEIKSSWLNKQLHEQKQRQQWWRSDAEVWKIGASFPFLGQEVHIQSGAVLQPKAIVDTNKDQIQALVLPNTAQADVFSLCKSWLRQQARTVFEQRLQYFAHQANLKYRRLTLGWSKRVWGWCKSDGSIMLNWRLIHYPQALIDYVVAHELTHLIHMHHGPEFWETLKIIYPDYLRAKQTLQRYHPSCIPNFSV